MKKSFFFLLTLSLLSLQAALAQSGTDNHMLPYYEIPDYPQTYTAESVAARMIDGVGFRYYWATEGLRPEDLAFRPNDEARTSEETIDHILGLSNVIVNSVRKIPNQASGEETSPLSFEEKRKMTLENLKAASDILKGGGGTLEEYNIVFQRGDTKSELPFWNQINGPISDALWHIGQVVSFRRSSGNPFSPRVSVLTGKVRN